MAAIAIMYIQTTPDAIAQDVQPPYFQVPRVTEVTLRCSLSTLARISGASILPQR